MKKERMFPIQGEHGRLPIKPGQEFAEGFTRPAGQVPWAVAERVYEQYAKECGWGQSLERLAERGGFSWSELVNLLKGDYFGGGELPFAEPKSESKP